MFQWLKSIAKSKLVYPWARPIHRVVLAVADFVLAIFFHLYPDLGRKKYNKMQKTQYKRYTGSFSDSKNLCVGAFDAHQSYPYEEYLLARYDGQKGLALDFACGMGRMIDRMLPFFDRVDGVDLSSENIAYAQDYLTEKGWPENRFSLYQSSGLGVDLPETTYYDFIFSTIALQHIPVYDIRRQIFSDLLKLLKPNGQCCFQIGFGWDNGTHWLDNHFSSRTTNAGHDVCVPNERHLEIIRKDFESIGFTNFQYDLKLSPHPELGDLYHPIWLFIYVERA